MKRLLSCVLFCLFAWRDPERAEQDARRFTADSFAAALAAEGLTQITLTPLSTGVDNSPHAQDPNQIYHSSDEPLVFAKDKEGKIYRIVRAPQSIGSESFSVFGCGRGGSGVMVYNQVSTYAGVSGEKTIRYPAKYVYLHSNDILGPCPQRP